MSGARRWLVALVALLAPAPAVAQCATGTSTGDVVCVFESPRWAGELAALSANGLIGGLTAGILRRVGGGSFADAFVRGLAGGAVTWAGKHVAGKRFDGAGLIGRELSAVGASAVRNAGEGRPALARLFLPIGPVWLEVRRGADPGVAARLDVAATAWLAYGLLEPELDFAAGATLSSGAPVFRTRGKLLDVSGDTHASGLVNAGIVYVADVPAYGASFADRVLAHERVHVLQADQLAVIWTDPAVGWAVRRAGLEAVNRRAVWNLSTELIRLLGGLIPEHRNRPWELESTFLAR